MKEVFFCIFFAASFAGACETFLTAAEISTDRARAVELEGSAGRFGWTVNGVGDVNGDGFDDFAVAAPYDNTNLGAVFVVFGRSAAAWESATFDFAASDPASWIKISGALNTFIGYLGIAHGDFNGDRYEDMLLSNSGVGKAVCVYGHNGTWGSFDAAEIETGDVPGFVVTGGSVNARYVGNAGDMNGDGIEDLLVVEHSGFAFVIFGVEGAIRSSFDVSTIDGQNGFSLNDGSGSLGIGYAFGSVGDINGDGLADLALGSFQADFQAGRAYILFARNVSKTGVQWSTSFDLEAELDGANGFTINGPSSGSYLGRSVVGAGDVNGDGFADIFIGGNIGGNGAWIVFGHPAPWDPHLNASQLDGSNGFHFADSLNVNGNFEFWGLSGGSAGDFNSDGFDDIIIGSHKAFGSLNTPAGAAAVIFGHNGTWPSVLSRVDATGSFGFIIDGPAANSYFGYSVRGAGDVNGDGIADVVVGAYNLNSEKGYAALVFGNDDHCAVCSNTTEKCLVCDDGFFSPDGVVCASSSSVVSSSTLLPTFCSSSAVSSQAKPVVVVIETGGGGGNAIEVAAEVAQLLGVDVGQISIVEITPGTFEVTVINEEVALQLVTLIEQCIEEN